MSDNQRGKVLDGMTSLAAELNPMKCFTFLLALAVTALASWIWLGKSGYPRPRFPLYGTIAVSYAGGFLIGRVFWRVMKTAAVVAAIVLGGLAVLNRAHIDTSKAKEAAQADSAWVGAQASRAKHYLIHFLPSGFVAGVGVFAGSRRGGGHEAKDRNTNANAQT